uniref:(northern house mosquito) hypothetical protein n=1 Tax=Culex pipiens TaxID=7175 RepID=A0A8D8HDN4_CULPI
MQNTVFGYIISGKVTDSASVENTQTTLLCIEPNLDEILQRFWDSEERYEERTLTQEEEECERHFVQTHERDEDGRYLVRLPLKTELLPLLGDAHLAAIRRLRSTERRFSNNTKLQTEYVKFMDEYEQLGHMQECKGRFDNPQFVLPHHAVLREESTTTKTRVVFDGSCRGSTQLSLNDVLYTGATVQPALYDTLINFRIPRYAVTADVEKMFRQIWVHPEDRKYQQICWRKDTSSPVKMFTLNTVTYGLSSSPFHAARVLNQLATDEGHNYPLAAAIVKNGMYVDDVLTGHDDWNTLKESCQQLNNLLKSGGMQLRKWASNEPQLLSEFSPELLAKGEEQLIDDDTTVKTLGLIWNTKKDIFQFKVPELEPRPNFTKRIVASEMAQIFDPLGLLGPVVMYAKLFIQGLWIKTNFWDTDLDPDDHQWWSKYRQLLSSLKCLDVPRQVVYEYPSIHCFVDASKRGYGCCVYVVSTNKRGKRVSHLLTAKSRVGPTKGQTIPRLELCAALLGSKLVAHLRQFTSITGPVTFWSDAMIVLHWIRSSNQTWKPFVTNRVTEIQKLTGGCDWKHIPTKENPADLISRGLWPDKLMKKGLWWYGPEILINSTNPNNTNIVLTEEEQIQLEEERRSVAALTATEEEQLFTKFVTTQSTLFALKRKMAWIIRFTKNCRLDKEKRYLKRLTADELENALLVLVKSTQDQFFSNEIRYLQQNNQIPSKDRGFKSQMKTLNPFIDESGLVRISGRLQNAALPFDTKCPIILPYNSHLTLLMMRETHRKALHAGPQLLLAILRQKYWPIKGKILAKRIVNECIICFRNKPTTGQQLMGQLPSVRTDQAEPFSNSGVDYCGPFWVRPPNKGRGNSIKIFVAIFICMWSKAVHIETVHGLTSEAFINALKRMMARRGRIKELYCDNGRNFVGANTLLKEVNDQLKKMTTEPSMLDYLAEAGINFHFNPARSPHFGGLWEAAVKSFKYHLYRIMKDTVLPIDDFQTLSTQIESILNSRPLIPLSNDPDDISALTPGHLINGRPAFSLIEPMYTNLPTNRLSSFQKISQRGQHFWNCWSREYLSLLQQRYKWSKEQHNLQPGVLVLLKDDLAPPLRWKLGRVETIYPGKDGLVRAIQVRTSGGSYRRAVTEVCPLPFENNESSLSLGGVC